MITTSWCSGSFYGYAGLIAGVNGGITGYAGLIAGVNAGNKAGIGLLRGPWGGFCDTKAFRYGSPSQPP